MATKKRASKKKSSSRAIATRKSTSMAVASEIRSRFEAVAEEEADRLGPSGIGNYLSVRNGKFEFQGSDLGKELDVVVIDFSHLNEWFDHPFDPDSPSNPACFSLSMLGPKGEDMVPDELSPEPQADFCKDCELNQFGSGVNGKGKACGNKNRIAMIHVDTLSNPSEAEVVFLRAGVNTAANFRKYAQGLKKLHNLPPMAVITHMSFDEKKQTPQVLFETAYLEDEFGEATIPAFVDTAIEQQELDPEIVDQLFELKERVAGDLMEKYDYAGYQAGGDEEEEEEEEEAPAPKRRGRGKVGGRTKATSKKKAGKKKSARRSRFN